MKKTTKTTASQKLASKIKQATEKLKDMRVKLKGLTAKEKAAKPVVANKPSKKAHIGKKTKKIAPRKTSQSKTK